MLLISVIRTHKTMQSPYPFSQPNNYSRIQQQVLVLSAWRFLLVPHKFSFLLCHPLRHDSQKIGENSITILHRRNIIILLCKSCLKDGQLSRLSQLSKQLTCTSVLSSNIKPDPAATEQCCMHSAEL